MHLLLYNNIQYNILYYNSLTVRGISRKVMHLNLAMWDVINNRARNCLHFGEDPKNVIAIGVDSSVTLVEVQYVLYLLGSGSPLVCILSCACFKRLPQS